MYLYIDMDMDIDTLREKLQSSYIFPHFLGIEPTNEINLDHESKIKNYLNFLEETLKNITDKEEWESINEDFNNIYILNIYNNPDAEKDIMYNFFSIIPDSETGSKRNVFESFMNHIDIEEYLKRKNIINHETINKFFNYCICPIYDKKNNKYSCLLFRIKNNNLYVSCINSNSNIESDVEDYFKPYTEYIICNDINERKNEINNVQNLQKIFYIIYFHNNINIYWIPNYRNKTVYYIAMNGFNML